MSTNDNSATDILHVLLPDTRLEISTHDPRYITATEREGADEPNYIAVDPYDEWPPTMIPHLYARTLVSCWNACAEAGLTVAQLDAGIIKRMVEYLSGTAVMSDGTVTFEV